MSWLTDSPLIAILRGITPQEVEQHIAVLLEEGFGAVEIPTNSPAWEESLRKAVNAFSSQAQIGAGTVLCPEAALKVAAAAGSLIVTPNVDIATIRTARDAGLLVCCGCATPTEMFMALDAGAQILKLFPAGAFGTGYIRAVKAVLPPRVPLFAVGGVTAVNLPAFLAAGCAGAGLGGDLYRPGQSAAQTGKKAKEFIAAYRAYQGRAGRPLEVNNE